MAKRGRFYKTRALSFAGFRSAVREGPGRARRRFGFCIERCIDERLALGARPGAAGLIRIR
jgi:hypothetical protein